MGRPVNPPLDNTVAPLHCLAVQGDAVSDAAAGPQVVSHVLDHALRPALVRAGTAASRIPPARKSPPSAGSTPAVLPSPCPPPPWRCRRDISDTPKCRKTLTWHWMNLAVSVPRTNSTPLRKPTPVACGALVNVGEVTQSKWACSPGAVSNLIVASGCLRRRRGDT